ncbi:MAG: pyroglutamyl-peptidase I [Methyloceanibacter sp.]|nr:pyroglutamyl-peptidase I [Methyloceanibacter sp.]
MARPRVLLTGFGPFPGVAQNPSAWLAETLAEQRPSPEFDSELHASILPTEWETVSALMPRLYETLQPHVMIHFGLSERAKAFRIERSAHNRAARRADAKGALPLRPVIRLEGPDRFDTELPADALAAHLKTCGLAAITSRLAGRYLCNFLYYHSLDWARRQKSACLVLFVHIPPASGRSGSFSEEALLHGAHETLRFVLAFARAHRPLKPTIGPAFARSEAIFSAKEA